ncbi:MAG: S8 family serine peptidase [Burkholderiaceae bacterium]
MKQISFLRSFLGFVTVMSLATVALAGPAQEYAHNQHNSHRNSDSNSSSDDETNDSQSPDGGSNVSPDGGSDGRPDSATVGNESHRTTGQLIVPQAQPGFGVLIDLQPVTTNSQSEVATRLIVYYRDTTTTTTTSSQSATIKDGGPADGSNENWWYRPLTDPDPDSQPADPVGPSNAPNTPNNNFVRNDQLSLQSQFGDSSPVVFAVPVSMAAAAAYAAELQKDPAVAAVLVDRRVGRHAIATNDTLNYVMWNLGTDSVGTAAAEPVWPQGQGSGVTVAVLDTGMVNHPDMVGAWSGGYDLITDLSLAGDGDARDPDPTDTMSCDDGSGFVAGNPHGLQVGSIIGARVNNNEGIAGVAPLANIQPIRVISSCGGWLSDVLDGMRWAVGLPVAGLPLNPNPAKILNLSLGTTQPGAACNSTVQSIIDEVRATGATIIVSTGNDYADAISVPAACNGVIAVTASSKFGNRADYANAGAGTTLAAPGGGCRAGADPTCFSSAYNYVPVANHDGTVADYVVSAGTSFAAPHVAGAAALLLERNPSRTPADIESALVNSARAFALGGCDNGMCGAGLLDVEASLFSQGFSVSADVSPSAARGNELVSLSATVTAGTNNPSYQWTQTGGTTVTLTGANTANASFVAPQVNETLSFSVSVTDSSGLNRIASGSTAVTIAPVLAPLGTIEVDPNAALRLPVLLADGGVPEAIAVDANATANGVSVDANEVVWTAPATGLFTFVVTPFDAVGSGVPIDLSVLVKGTNVSANLNPGGGGGLGLHGAVLLLLAWIGRRRLLDGQRDSSEFSAILGASVFALFMLGYSAPGIAATGTVNANLWLASLLHINGSHLFINLLGLMLLGIAFAGRVTGSAWLFALLVAAPATHWAVTTAGYHPWVAGLSTAMHAVVAWVAVQMLAQGFTNGEKRQWQFGLFVAVGLAVKVAIDSQFVTHWDSAQTAPALHAAAVAIAAAGSVIFSRPGLLAWVAPGAKLLR